MKQEQKNVIEPQAETETPDLEKAYAAIMQERQAREGQCREEIQALLQRFNCMMDVSVTLKAGQIIPKIEIVAR